MTSPLVLAHRALTLKAIENSLESIEAAIENDIQGIEIDVQLTKDEHFVCYHDDHLGRFSEHQGFISQITQKDFLKIHFSYHSKQAGLLSGTPITYEQILEKLPSNMMINVEVKGNYYSKSILERKLIGPAQERQKLENIIFSSFSPFIIWKLQSCYPRPRLGVLLNAYNRHGMPLIVSEAHFIESVHPHWSLCDKTQINAWQRRGKKIFIWTVNEVAMAKRYASWGIDGIISDFPLKLSDALKGI